MTPTIVAVGTTRKPKLAAVREALEQIGALLAANENPRFEIAAIEVDSGVAHTPSSREQLMRGARQRAESLQTLAEHEGRPWKYFVGLEGGLDSSVENGCQRVFLQSWAYVSDGSRGHFGSSGAIELPEVLADQVLMHGTELSTAIDHFAQQSGIRDAQGAWGVLSANQITRQDSFRIALIAAFAPFYNTKLYHRVSSYNPAAG